MATRTFTDAAGVEWLVFDVVPDDVVPGSGNVAAPGYESGWLLFQASGVKRRLAPFPAEWHSFSPGDLEILCAQAELAPATGLASETRAERPSAPGL